MKIYDPSKIIQIMTNLHVEMDQDDSQGDKWCARLDQKTVSIAIRSQFCTQ